MAVDPSIALSFKPIQVADPMAQYAQMAQIQHYQNQNRLADMQSAEYERARVEEEGTRNFLRGKDIYSPETRAGLLQFGKTGREFASGLATQQKLNVDTQTAEFRLQEDKLKHGLESVAGAPTPQAYVDKINDGVKRGYFDRATADQRIAQVPQDPEQYKNFRIESLLHLVDNKDKLAAVLPKIRQEKAGGELLNIQDNPMQPGYGKPIPGQSIKMTPTAGELMVDARARELLAAQQATGVLSAEAIDTAAEIYRQTGQMPISGFGKGAANMRAQIMNRASQIATGKGATPADTAANMIVAKQDIGSQTKALKDFSTGIQGRQVNAFNTAIDHLGTMDKLSDALANNDIKAFNSLGNVIARQTGSPAPTNFDAAKQIVTAEVIKAVVASGGGVTERQEAERNFAAANSPQQLKGIINTYKQLLGGQLNSLNLQYENTTGRKDFDKKLTGEAKNVVKELRGSAGGGAAPAGGVDTSNPLLAK
jgi:hypothetical protein